MKRSKFGPATALRIADDIVPIGEFKAHLSERIRDLQGRGRPLVVTQNGRAAAVVLTPAEFDRLTYREKFMQSIEAGLADAEAGRLISHDEVKRRMSLKFPSARKKK